MLPNIDLLLLGLVYHFNVGHHRNDSALVPNSLENVGLLPIVFYNIDVHGIWCLPQILIIVIDRDVYLLEHVCDDEAHLFQVVCAVLGEDVVDELHLPVAARLGVRLHKIARLLLALSAVDLVSPATLFFNCRRVPRFHSVNELVHPADLVLIVDAEDANWVVLFRVRVLLDRAVLLAEEAD